LEVQATDRRHDSPDPGRRTANEHFRAQWEVVQARSILVALGLHVALFVTSPTWTRAEPAEPEEFLGSQLEWIALRQDAFPEMGGSPALVLAPNDDLPPEGSAPGEGDLEEGGESDGQGGWTGGSAWGDGRFSDALLDRLRGRMPPNPTVLNTDPEGSSAEVEGDSEEAQRIRAAASATDFLLAERLGALDLDRLAAARPEMVLMAPSSWILLRNPAEVSDWMRRRTLRISETQEADSPSVSVAVWIDERGSVEWAEISQSSGRSDIDEMVLELFNEVVSFVPAREQSVRVPVSVIFWLTFPPRGEFR
jgi:TonB family protein